MVPQTVPLPLKEPYPLRARGKIFPERTHAELSFLAHLLHIADSDDIRSFPIVLPISTKFDDKHLNQRLIHTFGKYMILCRRLRYSTHLFTRKRPYLSINSLFWDVYFDHIIAPVTRDTHRSLVICLVLFYFSEYTDFILTFWTLN